MKTKRKLKKFVVPMVYVLSIVMLIFSVFFVERIVNRAVLKNEIKNDSNGEVENVINDDNGDVPVVAVETQIIRPYVDQSVTIGKNYYDYRGDASNQENAIIYYGDTYMQNSGVDYVLKDGFDVVSILDGTVKEIVEDEVMGKSIKIQHNNDLVSVYQSMGEVNVKVDDTVTQGMIIGKSGEAQIGKEMGKHLHFELYYKGCVVNPEEYYGKVISELN